MGRFVYEGMLSQTKKGRYLVKLENMFKQLSDSGKLDSECIR